MLSEEIITKLKRAGEIVARAREYGVDLIRPGARLVDIAEAIEQKILELGGMPAFPTCICVNDVAAHYAPIIGDETVVKEKDYVKIDLGAHVDGWIADSATTVRLAGEDTLIRCAKKMLEVAVPMMTPGTPINDISTAIEGIAQKYGMVSVRNLTSHSLTRYVLHGGVTIPNVRTPSTRVIEEDEVYAIEPFCTTLGGWTKESEPTTIFRWITDRPVRLPEGRKVLELARTRFSGLPFTKRWLQKDITPAKLDIVLKQLVEAGALYSYSTLKEQSGAPVAQFEHTIIAGKRPIVTTKL